MFRDLNFFSLVSFLMTAWSQTKTSALLFHCYCCCCTWHWTKLVFKKSFLVLSFYHKNVTCLRSQLPCQWARPRSPSCGCWGWRGHSTWESGAERAPQSGFATSVNSEHPVYYGSPVRKLFRSFRVTMSSENEKLETIHIWETKSTKYPNFLMADIKISDSRILFWPGVSGWPHGILGKHFSVQT